jgi:hypothetical protein
MQNKGWQKVHVSSSPFMEKTRVLMFLHVDRIAIGCVSGPLIKQGLSRRGDPPAVEVQKEWGRRGKHEFEAHARVFS